MDVERETLRDRLAARQQEKAELERGLHAVQRRFHDEVAPLKEKVLRLRMEQLRRTAQRHMRSAAHRNDYHEARREYETFQEKRIQSTPPDPETLRARYREASKQCHPDVVPDAYAEQAAATFQALKSAYQSGHAQAVRAIAESLDRWGFPPIHSMDEDPEGAALGRAVSGLEDAINALRNSDLYDVVAEAEDVETILQTKKEALLQILRRLEQAT